MALRSGYYGLKRAIKYKLEDIAKAWDGVLEDISDIGASTIPKNLLPYPYTDKGNKTDNGITFIDNGDGTITVKAGTASANAQYFLAGSSVDISRSVDDLRGKYFSKGTISTTIIVLVWYYDSSKNFISGEGATEKGIAFTIPENAVYYSMLIRVINGSVISSDIVVKPMISDDGGEWEPFLLSNQTLTLKVEDLEGSAAEQKTTINAIIAAATGAADFAAFKAAMEAITPVTRSAAPAATREVIEEEPVTVKKTTRKKSTAAADTEKEGE